MVYYNAEFPSILDVFYINSYGQEKSFRTAAYFYGSSCTAPSGVKLFKISQNQWTKITATFDVNDLNLVKITKAIVTAAGWSYDTYFTGLQIKVILKSGIMKSLSSSTTSPTTSKNVVSNGDFQSLTGWKIHLVPNYDDPQGVEKETIPNEFGYSTALKMYKYNAGGRGGHVSATQSMNEPLQKGSYIKVEYYGAVKKQSLDCIGYTGEESPLLLRIHYKDSNGNTYSKTLSMFVYGSSCKVAQDYILYRIQLNYWYKLSYYFYINGEGLTLTSVMVAATGWTYESYITGVKVTFNLIGDGSNSVKKIALFSNGGGDTSSKTSTNENTEDSIYDDGSQITTTVIAASNFVIPIIAMFILLPYARKRNKQRMKL